MVFRDSAAARTRLILPKVRGLENELRHRSQYRCHGYRTRRTRNASQRRLDQQNIFSEAEKAARLSNQATKALSSFRRLQLGRWREYRAAVPQSLIIPFRLSSYVLIK
jgi:hypothetical protein